MLKISDGTKWTFVNGTWKAGLALNYYPQHN